MKKVSLKFSVVDKEQATKLENNTIQLFANKLITLTEARKKLGEPPLENPEDTYFELFEKPLAELKTAGFNNGESENKARPENQFGKRAGPSFDSILDKNYKEGLNLIEFQLLSGLKKTNISASDLAQLQATIFDNYKIEYNAIAEAVDKRVSLIKDETIDKMSIYKNMKWRFDSLLNAYSCKAYNYGVIVSSKQNVSAIQVEDFIGLESELTETCITNIDNSINIFDIKLRDIPPFKPTS
jgi:hypothetical protein